MQHKAGFAKLARMHAEKELANSFSHSATHYYNVEILDLLLLLVVGGGECEGKAPICSKKFVLKTTTQCAVFQS